MSKVFITGMGAISSLGTNISENHSSLRSGKTGIGKAHHFQSAYVATMPFAEIDLSDEQLKNKLSIHESGVTRTTLIALHAFNEAIQDAQLSQEDLSNFETGFISSSTVGGMCYTDQLFQDANQAVEASEFIHSYEGSNHTQYISEKFQIKGYTDTINTACSSSANAILVGARLIQSGRAKRVIVGGADCLSKYTVNGFNALRILSEAPSRPFDKNRDGLTLGEAAAYLVLEGEESCQNKKKYAELIGFGNANDAFHPSATSDEAFGPIAAMTSALDEAGIQAHEIDCINAHGTGTPNNDITESFAFSHVFDKVPPFSSTKSYSGHTLSAAGSLEAIFSILSINHSEVYPSLNCENPIDEFDFQVTQSLIENRSINKVISNSFGFGGNCTSLIFSACS